MKPIYFGRQRLRGHPLLHYAIWMVTSVSMLGAMALVIWQQPWLGIFATAIVASMYGILWMASRRM